jgi:hypothetical protein
MAVHYVIFHEQRLDENGNLTIEHHLGKAEKVVVVRGDQAQRKEVEPDQTTISEAGIVVGLQSFRPIVGTWLVEIHTPDPVEVTA